MTAATLRADCARCAALCCVALAFDRSEMFAIDKANGEACPHLDGCGRCRIHAEREQRGFRGCSLYECHGAGQRVTQEIFGGRTWQDEPDLLMPMMRAFETMLVVHELVLLLREAEKLVLPDAERAKSAGFLAMLEPDGGWSEETLSVLDIAGLKMRVREFLTSLRRYAAPRQSNRT